MNVAWQGLKLSARHGPDREAARTIRGTECEEEEAHGEQDEDAAAQVVGQSHEQQRGRAAAAAPNHQRPPPRAVNIQQRHRNASHLPVPASPASHRTRLLLQADKKRRCHIAGLADGADGKRTTIRAP